MREFLQVGLVCYLVQIGLMAYIGGVMIRRKAHAPFACYTCYFAVQGLVMFTLFSQGNGGWYRTAYWVSEYIQDGLLAWIVIDGIWRWKERKSADNHILAGTVITFLFPVILQYREWVPIWTRDIPVYSALVAQAVWIRGLILKPQEDV